LLRFGRLQLAKMPTIAQKRVQALPNEIPFAGYFVAAAAAKKLSTISFQMNLRWLRTGFWPVGYWLSLKSFLQSLAVGKR
jgi:hypothetical protein